MAQKKNTTISLSNAADQSPVGKEAAIKPQRQRKVRPAAEMLVLEQRMMFDGAAMSTADLLNERNTTSSDKAAPLYRETPDLFTPQALPQQPGRLIVISAALPEANRIRLGLADKGEVVELAEGSDSLSQISQLLASRSQIEELHIISHGEPGTLLLGDLRLDNSTLQARQAEILNWQSSLTANADILLYGCDVGSGDAGLVFLQTLQGLTGADLAASSDDTGSQQLGGNNTLELRLGQVDATSALDTELLDALGLLLDTTPPAAATTQISFSGAAITVTVNLTESVATSTNLANASLALTTGGAARSASFVAAESNLAAGKLVYRYSGNDFTQGVQLGQISLNGAVIRDAAGNALTPAGLNPLLASIEVTEGQTLSFNGGYTGAGDFIKTGLGELILTGNSTHTGNTVVRGGTLTITSDLQLGPNVPTPTAGRLVIEDGGKLKINATLALDPERGIRVLGQGTIEVASGFTATYNGIITGANASSGLIKTGLGTLVLGGAQTYSGSTDIQAGVLAVSGSLADATTVKVAQGATYQLNSSDTVAAIEGAGNITSGVLTGAVATLTVSGNTTPFSGVIGDGTAGGKLALTKVGADTLTLSGLNTYTGATAINAGTLLLSEGSYRTPSFNIATGAVLRLHTDAWLDYGTNTNFTGTGTLLKTGFGTTLWGTTAATFAMGAGGLIDVQAGTFVGGSSTNENWTNNLASLNVAARAVFMTVEADVRVDALTGSGAVQIGLGGYPNSGLTIGVNNFAAGTYNSAGSSNFSGTLFDLGRLIKAGTGTLTLSGNSVHTGTTTVQAGTLRLGVDQAFSGTSALTIDAGATFDLNGKRQSLVSVVQGTGTGAASLALGTGGQLEINGNNLTFAGVISGDGSLRKVGNTTLTLTGTSTFTGETHIAQGALTLAANGALGPSERNGAAAVNSAVIIGELGTLTLNNFNQRIGSLAGAGTLTLGTGMLVVGGNNTNTTFTGVFSTTGTGTLGTAGNGHLVKEGTGTLTLGGATSNSSGRAVVNAGTLVLDKASDNTSVQALSAGTGVVSLQINNGGTVRIAGTGSSQIGTTSNVLLNAGGTLDLNGRTLTLNELTGSGGVTNTLAGSGSTLSLGLGGTLAFTFAGTLTDGAANGSTPGGTVGLTKVGSGTLILSAVQAYSGDTTVSAGTLQLSTANQLSPSTTVIVNAKLVLGGFNQRVGALASTAAGTVELGSATLDVGGNNASTTFSGSVTGTGGVVKRGTGTLSLTGNNTYTGSTAINSGSVSLGMGDAATMLASTSVQLGGGASLIFNTSSNLAVANGLISGSGQLVQRGTGNLTFNGANTYSGGTLLEGGAVLFAANAASSTALGSGTVNVTGNTTLRTVASGTPVQRALGNAFTLQSGATLSVDASSSNGTLGLNGAISGSGHLAVTSAAGTAVILGGNVNITGTTTVVANSTLQVGNGGTTGTLASASVSLAYSSILRFHRSDASNFNSPVSGAGAVDKIGAGSLTLGGKLSHTGTTTVSAGSLVAGAAQVMSTTSYTTVSAGATLDLNGLSQTLGSLAGSGTVQTGSVAQAVLSVGDANHTTFSGAILGSGSLSKNGTGILTLSGANSYTGETRITMGGLTLSGADRLSNQTALSVANGATFTLGGVAQRIGSLAGAGSVVLGAGTLSTGTNNLSTQFSGVISGTGGVAKAGTGEWTLTGASTYTGVTTLNGGMLTLNGSLAASAMTVNTGTTLAGSGSTAGAVTVQSGGTLSPGQRLGNQSLPGLLTLSNSLSLLAGSTLVMDLDPNGNNLTDDQILGPTSVSLAGNLVVNGLSSFASLTGGSWRLINSGAVPTGSFSSVTLPSVTAVTSATSAFSVVTNESPVANQFPVTLRLASLSAALPQPHSLSLAGADDTGSSNRDGITRNTSALTVGGVAQPGKKVWLFNDLNNNGQLDEGEVLATNITATATYGVFTHDIELGAGTHRIMAVQVESDGSRSPVSQALLITVDLEATLSPGVPTLVNDSQQTSDTGLLGSDLITNNPFPTFRFQLPTTASNVSAAYAASAGMKFELRRSTAVEATRILTADDITRGYIDIVPDAAIPQGSYFQQWRGVITDQAGNISSTDTVWSIPLLRVDTTAPGVPYGNPQYAGTALELLTNSDTGRSSTDTAIAVNTGFSVRGISSTDTRLIGLRLYNPNGTSTDLGTLSFSDTTHWTYTYTGAALADGNYALRARAMDLAGNWSAESVALNFSIDTSAPAALAAPSLTAASDSGLSSTDGITNLTSSLVVSGVAAPSAQVRLLDYGVSASNTGLSSLGDPVNGFVIATATANAQGVYTFSNLNLAPGIHHLRVIQNDVAGNWSAPGTALRANIDTQPPVTPTVFFTDTSSRTPTLSGTYDASNTEQLVVRINNRVYGVTAGTSVNIDGTATITVAGLVLNAASGTWSLAIPRERELIPSLAGTLYTVTVMATDLAGNRVISNSRDQLRLSSAEIGGAGIPISTPVNMLAYASQIGQLYSFSVTGRAQLNGTLQGSDLYALNTNLNIAAVHAGMVAVGETKTVSVMIMPSGSSPASVRNGVSSDAMSGVGFRFVRSELTPLGISLAAAGDSATVGDNITRQLAPVLRIALPSSVQAGDTVRLAMGTTEVLRHTLSAADLVNRGSSGAPAYWVDLQAHTLFNGNNTVYNTANDNAITAQVLRVQNGAFQASASVTLQTLLVDNVASPAPYSTTLARGDDLGNPLVPQHQTDNRLPRGNQFNLTGWVHANYGTVSVEVWAGTRLLGSTGVTADSRWSFFLPATAQPLADGVHNITVIAIDAAGNRSNPSTALALTIDTAIGKPGNLAIHSSFDSGIKGDNITSRALDSALLITGKADPSLPIHPYWDGSNYTFNNSLRVFDDANNNGILDAGEELAIYNSAGYQWSDWRGNFNLYIDPKQLAEGTHRLRVIQMDAAGNLSVSSDALTIHIDRAPQAPLGVFLAPGQDDGLFSADGVIQNAQPTLRVQLAPNARVGDRIMVNFGPSLVMLGATGLTATDLVRGHVDIRSTITLPQGTHWLYARSMDASGNTSAINDEGALRLDVMPTEVPAAPNIAFTAADDTGPSSTDLVTRKATGWTVSGTATGSTASQINIYAGTTLIGSVQPATQGGAWSFTYNGPALADGVYTVYARGVHANGLEGRASAALFLRIDASAYQRSQFWLDAADDTGPVNSDGITNKTRLTFRGIANPDATVEIFEDVNQNGIMDSGEKRTTFNVNGTTVVNNLVAAAVSATTDATGTFAADIELGTGLHTILARQTFMSGSVSVTSLLGAPVQIRVDVDYPFTPNYAQLSSVGGLEVMNDAGETVSSNPNPTLTLSLPQGVELGDEVLLMNGGTVIIRQSVTLRDLASAAIDMPITAASRLTDGTYTTLKVRLVDKAGNASPDVQMRSLVIRTTGIAAPTEFKLLPEDDTGSSSTDNRTNRTTGFTVTGKASATAISVQIYANGELLGEAYPDSDSPFAFSFTYTGQALTPGSYLLEARAMDVLGLPGLTSSVRVVFDDKLPPPSRLSLNPLDDSGSDSSDGITSLTTGLRVSGTAELGVTVRIFNDLNDNNLIDDGELLNTSTADATTGAFSGTINLGSGNHRLRAMASDAEGNISLASASLALTVDRQPVSPPPAITLLPSSDTGLRSNDRLTADNQPIFRISLPADAQVGDVVWLTYAAYLSTPTHPYVLGIHELTAADIVDGGRGFIDIQSRQVMADRAWTVGNGYFIGAYVVDIAGNMGRMNVLPSLQIDTAAPNPDTHPFMPPAPLLEGMDDSGNSRLDGITVVNKNFTLYGTVPTGTRRVELFDGDTSLGFAQMLSSTAWSFQYTGPAYNATTRVFTLTATDEAGNVSNRSLPLMVTFDANAPAQLWAPSLLSTVDTGRLTTDGVTSNHSGLAFTGFANPAAVVRLYDDRDNNGLLEDLELIAQANADSAGKYDFINIELGLGGHFLRVIQQDRAGLWSAPSSATPVTIDKSAPVRPTVVLQNISNATSTPTLTGSYDRTDTDRLFVLVNGQAYSDEAGRRVTIVGVNYTTLQGLTLNTSAGTWSLTLPRAQALSASTIPYQVTLQAVDLAGNISFDSSIHELLVTPVQTDPLAPSYVRITAATDSGVSDADSITQQLAPVFEIGLNTSTVQVGDVVRLLQGSTEINRVTLTAEDLAQGWLRLQPQTQLTGTSSATGTVYAEATAIRASVVRLSNTGTQESASTLLQILAIDTVVPTAPSLPDLNKGDDRGNTYFSNHASDNVVRRANGLSFTGTVTADQNITAVWLYANNQLLGSTGVNSSNAWAFFYPSTAAPLANGTYQITAVAVDRTGNRSLVSTALTLTIDSTITAPQSLMVVAASDSGARGDGLTRVKNGLRIQGQGEAGASLRVFDDRNGNGKLDTGEELTIDTWTYASQGNNGTVNINGAFTLTLFTALSEGDHSLRVLQTDRAGNTSLASNVLNVRIDTGAPQPLAVSLAPGMDDGLFGTDAITSIERPTFRVSLPPEVVEGDLVQLFRHFNGSLSWQIALKRLDELDLSRGWIDLTSTVALAGDYNGTAAGWGIFARITDAAGNASPISTTRGNLPWLTVDRTAPVAPNTLALMAQDDTGANSWDNITAKATGFTLTGANIAADVRRIDLFDGDTFIGSAAPGSGDTFSFTYDGPPLIEGVHWITAKAVDAAGNISPGSNVIQLAISATELSPVQQPGKLQLAAANDSGLSRNDAITNVGTVTINGMMTPGAKVQLFVDLNGNGLYSSGEAIGAPVTANATTGAFSVTSVGLRSGNNVIRAYAYNATTGMPMGEVSEALTVTLKTTPPGQPGVVELLNNSDTPVSGSLTAISSSDRITADNTPTLRVPLPAGTQAGEQLRLYNGSTLIFSISLTTAQVTAGVADITIPSTMPLANRSYNFTAAVFDMAGNEGERSATAYTTVIDTLGPLAPTGLDLLARDDSGVIRTDNITAKTSGLTLVGNVPTDAVRLNIYDTSTDPTVREPFDNSTFLSTNATAMAVYPPDVRNVSLLAATLNGLGIAGSVLADVVTAKTGSADRWLMGVFNSELDQTQMVEIWLSLDANGQLHASTAAAAFRQGDHTLNGTTLNAAWSKPTATTGVATSAGANGFGVESLEGVFTGVKTTLIASLSGNALGDSTFTHTTGSLAAGLHNFTVRGVDLAGNEGAAASLKVSIDNASEAPSLALGAGLDVGNSTIDGLTRTATALVFNGSAEVNARVVLFDDTNNNGVLNPGEELAETLASTTNGAFSFTGINLGAGQHLLRAIAFDNAGNASLASEAVEIFIDLQVPNAPTHLSLSPASDTGLRSDDAVTTAGRVLNLRANLASDAVAGDTLSLYNSTTLLSRITLTSAQIAAGFADLTVSANALVAGAYVNVIRAQITDRAGNDGAFYTLPDLNLLGLTAAPTGLDLITDSDSASAGEAGSNSTGTNTDNITRRSTNFVIGGSLAGNIVGVLVYDDTDRVNPLGQAEVNLDTLTWTFNYTGAPYADGTRAFFARAIDMAGNRSDFSAPLWVSFDTNGPARATWTGNGNFDAQPLAEATTASTGGNVLAGWTITGNTGTAGYWRPSSNTASAFYVGTGYLNIGNVAYTSGNSAGEVRFVQNNALLAQSGETFTLSVDLGNRGGNATAHILSNGTYISLERSDGVVLAKRFITEAELGPDGSFKTFTLNYTAQSADVGLGVRTVFGVGQDSRTNNHADFNNVVLSRSGTLDPVVRTLSNTGTTTLSGYADPGARVVLFVDSNQNGLIDHNELSWNTTSNANTGLFTQEIRLPQGTHSVRAMQFDRAGNLSLLSDNHQLIVALTPPSRPTVDRIATFNSRPTLTGTYDANQTHVLTASVQGTRYTTANGLTLDNANGTWSLTLPTAIPAGSQPGISVVATDILGNASVNTDTGALLVIGDSSFNAASMTQWASPEVQYTGQATPGWVNASTYTLRQNLPASGITAGDTLTVKQDGTTLATYTLTSSDLANGVANISITPLSFTAGSAAPRTGTDGVTGYGFFNTATLNNPGVVTSWTLYNPSITTANWITPVIYEKIGTNYVVRGIGESALVPGTAGTYQFRFTPVIGSAEIKANYTYGFVSGKYSATEATPFTANGSTVGLTYNATGGTWTFTATPALTLGGTQTAATEQNRIYAMELAIGPSVISLDHKTAGSSTVSARSYMAAPVVDTRGPTSPSAPNLIAPDDLGSSSTDGITLRSTPWTLFGSVQAGQGITQVRVMDGQTILGHANIKADNTYAFHYTGDALTEGTHAFSVVAIDSAGNDRQAISYSPYLNSTATAIGVTAGTLSEVLLTTGTMNGASIGLDTAAKAYRVTGTTNRWIMAFNDNVNTKMVEITLSLSGTNVLAAATAAKYKAHGNNLPLTESAINTAWNTGVAWSVATSASTAGYGVFSLNGSGGLSISPVRTVSIDTATPSVTAPVLNAASDTGAVNNDGITRLTTGITVTGTAEAGSVVQIFRDRNDNARLDDGELLGNATLSGTTYTLANLSLPVGNHTLFALATDSAGNVRLSAASNVKVDNLVPVPTRIDLLSSSDSGLFNADNTTRNQAPTWRVSLPEGVVAGDKVRLYSANNTTSNLGALTLTGADIVAGYVDFTPSSALRLTGAGYLDISRNEPETFVSREIVFKTTTSGGLFGVQSGGAYDRGLWITANGNIASFVWNAETLTSTGLNLKDGLEHTVVFTIGPGGQRIYVDGALVLSGTKAASDYNWDTNQRLGFDANGGHFIGEILSYRAWDAHLTLAQVTGTAALPAAVSQLVFGANAAVDIGTKPSTNIRVIGTIPGMLVEGVYTNAISARIEDLSGNLSGPRLLDRAVIDITPPTAPTVALLPADDLGSLANDNLTSRNAGFTLTGTLTANEAVRIDIYQGNTLLGSTPVVGAAASWSWTYTGAPLADGLHTFTAKAVDAAGNESTFAAPLVLNIDANALRAVRAFENTLWISTTGHDSQWPDDRITQTNTINIAGRMAPNSNVWLFNDLNSDGLLDPLERVNPDTVITTDGRGIFTAQSVVLTTGLNRIRAFAVDNAGNLLAEPTTIEVTLDATPALMPGAPQLLLSDGITADDDGLTQELRPFFKIALPPQAVVGDELRLFRLSLSSLLDSKRLTAQDITAGFAVLRVRPGLELTPTATTTYSFDGLQAMLVDRAGNASTSAVSQRFGVIDAPISSLTPVRAVVLDTASNTGYSDVDTLTQRTNPTLKIWLGGNAAVGGKIEIYNANSATSIYLKSTVTLTQTDLNNGYALATTTGLSAGQATNYYQYTPPGTSTPSIGMTAIHLLSIDATLPTAVTALDIPASDDWGPSNTDNITGKNRSIRITGTLPADAVMVNLYAEHDPAGGNTFGASSLLGSAFASNGNFTFSTSATTALADGKYRIRAKAVDVAGNESAVHATSIDLIFTIDTSAPALPTLTVANDDMRHIAGNTRITNQNNYITLSGTGEAGSRLHIFNDLNNNGVQVVEDVQTAAGSPVPLKVM